ncbi:methyltransferase [Streptomyces sp. IMTB 1903]|uniref:methyltransferase n=1 Tax=Streptomyces sp. IMTB 1903 TaxID=1776680 RepID=UPI000757B2B6|nr:methyltransferase [Streptomyces sp. IMTB 1903]
MTDSSAHTQTLLDMSDLLKPNAVRVAATLGIADLVAEGGGTAATPAERAGAHPEGFAKLLRYLVELGLFTVDADGVHALTDLSRPLLRTNEPSLAQYLSMEGLFGRVSLGLVGLLHTVRTGEASHAAVFGRDYWDEINTDPVYVRALEAEGPTEAGWDADAVIRGYDRSTVRNVADVGGNNGTLLIELLCAHPHLRGTVIDLPNVAGIAARRIEEAGLADRGTAVAASFFEELPKGHDVYLLSGILADWSDEKSVAILRRVAEAAGPDGRVLLAEINLPETGTGLAAADTALRVAAIVPVPARTVEAVKDLAGRAGLTPTWQGPVTPVRSVVEFSPAVAGDRVPEVAGA